MPTNTMTLDQNFALFCEQGRVAHALGEILATGRFLRATDAMQAACAEPVRPSEPRIFTGYMPKDQRRAVRHREYSDGLRDAKRLSADAATKGRAAANGFVGGVYVGGAS